MNDAIYTCPMCGTPAVDHSALVGGAAQCRICTWTGVREELVAIPFTNYADSEQVVIAIRKDVRLAVRTASDQLVKLLVRWGFVSASNRNGQLIIEDKTAALRYINAIANGIFKSIVEEREKIEVERVRGS